MKTMREILALVPEELLDTPIKSLGVIFHDANSVVRSMRIGCTTQEFHHMVGAMQAMWLTSGKPDYDDVPPTQSKQN